MRDFELNFLFNLGRHMNSHGNARRKDTLKEAAESRAQSIVSRVIDCEILYCIVHSFSPEKRATSVPLPADTSGRQRNFSRIGLDFCSTASAIISPRTGANLNPCPQSPAAMTNPSRSGSGAIQKFPSCVSQYMHTRV